MKKQIALWKAVVAVVLTASAVGYWGLDHGYSMFISGMRSQKWQDCNAAESTQKVYGHLPADAAQRLVRDACNDDVIKAMERQQ